MYIDSPASWQRIYLILWPLIVVGVLVFIPLGWVLSLIAFCAALWLLATNRRVSALFKGVVASLWVLGLGLIAYIQMAFAAIIEAADLPVAAPAWTGGFTVAAIAAPLSFLAALILFLVGRAPRLRRRLIKRGSRSR